MKTSVCLVVLEVTLQSCFIITLLLLVSVISFPLLCLKQVQHSVSQNHKNNSVKIILENKIVATKNSFRILRINSKPNSYGRMCVALGAQIESTTSNPLAWCHVELYCDYCVSFRFVSSPCLALCCVIE